MWICNIIYEIFHDTGLLLSFLSLVATIAVSFMIYWLQRHHEKEIEHLQEERRKQELQNEANKFLVDNEEERDCIPWCVLASQLHRHEHHTREIYKNFCRASDELQCEILHMAGYKLQLLPQKRWYDYCFSCLTRDIQKYKLGRDFLYDGGKYFSKGYIDYKNEKWSDITEDIIFEPIYKGVWWKLMGKISCRQYIGDYIKFLKRNKRIEDITVFNLNPIPPIDCVWDKISLSEVDEKVMCAWVITLVEDIVINIPAEEYVEPIIDYTDAQVIYYEDKYYEVLQVLYNTYVPNLIAEENKESLKDKIIKKIKK